MPADQSPQSSPNQHATSPTTAESETGPEATADPLLPPVEPPNARFIMQLFIIPAIIVLCVVMVWMLFGWLASRGEEDASSIVKSLRSSSHARWQAANELARMLQLEQRYPKLKENRLLAGELAQLLSEYLEAGNADEQSINMRSFLCRSLGEFRVDDGMAVLLNVVHEDLQPDVRREAIKALAVLGNTFEGENPPKVSDGNVPFDVDELVRTLIRLSTDQDELIRSETAYAMGAYIQGTASSIRNTSAPGKESQGIDSQETSPLASLVEPLVRLIDDTHVDTRYNAALALARIGNLAAVGTVAEMLDLEKLSVSMTGEHDPQLQAYKRNLMLRNAIEAAAKLIELNPQHDLSVLQDAVNAFLDAAPAVTLPAPIPQVLRDQADQVLRTLRG
jgi:HEAT repeat protein